MSQKVHLHEMSGKPLFQFTKFCDATPELPGAYLLRTKKHRHHGLIFPGATQLSFAALNPICDELCFYHEIDGRIVRVSDACWAKASWCYLGWEEFGKHDLFISAAMVEAWNERARLATLAQVSYFRQSVFTQEV